MSIRSDIAQAVTDEINAGVATIPSPFGGLNFQAERLLVPLMDLQDLKTLHVSVVGRSYSDEPASRAGTFTTLEIDVAVQKKLDGTTATEVDPLADLIEQLIVFFRNRNLADYSSAHWIGTKNTLIYIPEHMEEKRLFTSVITLTYKVLN